MTMRRLERPLVPARPPGGILAAEHFQMAYATNDIDRAKQLFGDRYGISRWTKLAGELDQGGRIHVELAWVGPLMYELMFAEGPGSETYRAVLTDEPQFQLRHHHLGYMVYEQSEWDRLMELVAREGWSMPLNRNNPGFLASCMVKAPEPGHFLEYIFPEAAGLEFFNNVERN